MAGSAGRPTRRATESNYGSRAHRDTGKRTAPNARLSCRAACKNLEARKPRLAARQLSRAFHFTATHQRGPDVTVKWLRTAQCPGSWTPLTRNWLAVGNLPL